MALICQDKSLIFKVASGIKYTNVFVEDLRRLAGINKP